MSKNVQKYIDSVKEPHQSAIDIIQELERLLLKMLSMPVGTINRIVPPLQLDQEDLEEKEVK